MTSEISKIKKNLYICSLDSAYDSKVLKKYKIDIIINCTKLKRKNYTKLKYYKIPINDDPESSDINYLKKNYKNIIHFIDSSLKKGKRILVHCYYGYQRSPSVVAMYIMYKYNMSYKSACKYIKKKRKVCFDKHINFSRALSYVDNKLYQDRIY